jgi:peptidyl-prolyl cis-trans isomerase SurA
MRIATIAALAVSGVLSHAAIVDRIAVVAGKRVIKDSDIVEELRLTAFLNNEQPSFLPAARKKAADRLIDQEIIRNEIEEGDYPAASLAEAKNFLTSIKKDRFATAAAYTRALASYQIAEDDLIDRLCWQLTVLRFIDMRFRPGAHPTDAEIQQYYNQHRQQLIASNPGKTTLAQLQPVIEETLAGEQVNKALDDWLRERRMAIPLVYHEEDLK